MKNYPLVSVVSGYYNRKKNLRESIQSILDQDYPNFEYIIFDDCSTDGTCEIIETFDDPRIKLIRHEENMGFTKGIIHAISQAKGEFIAVHGAGDISKKNRLTMQANYLFKNPEVGIVSCNREQFSETERRTMVYHDKDIIFEKRIFFHNPIVQGDVMFRKDLYEKVGGYDPWITYAQDRDLWLRMMPHTEYHLIPEVLYERGMYRDSVSGNLYKKIQQRFFTCLARERALKGRDFSLLFRDKYQTVADEAVVMHYQNKSSKHRKQLLAACRKESSRARNKLYASAHMVPGINRFLYWLCARSLYKNRLYLDANYREMEQEEIYRLAVLDERKK